MNVLLVHARFPVTYWGFQYSLPLIGKRAANPPLGLVTLAACLPDHWRLRLVDLNVERLTRRGLRWADAVLVSGMLVQAESVLEVVRRARAAGCVTVAGGAGPTSAPELFAEADVVFRGEAEGRTDELVAAVERPAGGGVVLETPAGCHPDLGTSPVPRFDLLRLGRYASMSVQYSRGCPFGCEFCDVIEVFGRRPRVKPAARILDELDALHRLGYRGSLFLVDDNFIGNRRSVRDLLPRIAAWQEAHGRPFTLYTEASVDLAADPELVRSMVDAGFSSVFVGLETPSIEALSAAGKRQNLRVDLEEAVRTLTGAGLEVMGGFIVGFDSDRPGIFAAQSRFIRASAIPVAMVGLLSALPGTALWRRLAGEGRLRGQPSGDQFERPNFEPGMDEEALLRGYGALLGELYSPREYYRRCADYLRRVGPRPAGGGRGLDGVLALVRATVRVGVLSGWRTRFWALVGQGARGGLHSLVEAVTLAVKGEHMIRYTARHVLPRIEAAVATLVLEREQAGSCGEAGAAAGV
jgi:radical SAM superfamily enzyme YgiQ (UPF0313 family)